MAPLHTLSTITPIIVIIIVVITLIGTPPTAAGAEAKCPAACSCVAAETHRSSTDALRGVAVTCSGAELTSLSHELPPSATSLDVSGNRLELLDAGTTLPRTGVHAVSTANFSRNRIASVATEAFSRWSSLVSLDLSANRLSSIDHGTFRGAPQTSLQNLDLSGNRLTDVDGGFSGMNNLFRLDLRNNYLTSLTEFTFRDLSALRYLFLTNNRIYRIERRALRVLHQLLYLVLRGNPLTELDRLHFHTPSALSYIDMSECGLTAVPRGLPASLRYVQLRRNNLTVLTPDASAQCPQVNILVLDENRIHTIHNDTFTTMSHLQQLWLNDNRLTSLPRPLPPSLRRLLVDSNDIETVEDSSTFPPRSQLTTLSLAGNHVHRVSPTVLQRLSNLQSLDFSNNQLRRIDTDTFSANPQLRSLTLAKNPLVTIQTGAFNGLRTLKALTLSYVPTVDIQLSPIDLFRPLNRLSRLDLDNSPGVAKAVLWTELGDERPSHVQELGLVNCDLTTLPRDFPRRFPRLTALRVSSARWHCDRALMWFRDWLLDPGVDVRVQSLSDIRCATPESLRHRPIVSLNDNEFVETTWTPRPAPPTLPPTTTKTAVTTMTMTVKTRKPKIRASPTAQLADDKKLTTLPLAHSTWRASDVNADDAGGGGGGGDDGKSSSVRRKVDAVVDKHRSTRPALNIHHRNHQSGSTSELPPHHRSSSHGHHSRRRGHHDNDQLSTFKTRLIVSVVTIGVTLVIAALIVAAIVYLWRRSRKTSPPPRSKPFTPPPPSLSATVYDDDDDTLTNGTSTPRTFIRYKNRNGVLYFSTPAASDSLTTSDVDPQTPDSCLIGETGADGTGTIRYVLPPSSATGFKTRVYRWEDF